MLLQRRRLANTKIADGPKAVRNRSQCWVTLIKLVDNFQR